MSYSTAYVQPGVVTLLYDIDEDIENYLKCFWLPICSPDGETDVPAEISLQHLVNYDPYLMFNTWDSVNPNPLALFSQQQWKNKLWFFSLPSDFGLDDEGVIALQPSQTSEQPAVKSNTKKRSKEIIQP